MACTGDWIVWHTLAWEQLALHLGGGGKSQEVMHEWQVKEERKAENYFFLHPLLSRTPIYFTWALLRSPEMENLPLRYTPHTIKEPYLIILCLWRFWFKIV